MLSFSKLITGYDKPLNQNPISASFKQGSLIVLLGRNGCGKSTLLKSASGFLTALNGQVLIDMQDINTIKAKQLARKLSIVNTENILTVYMKVYDLIALGRFPYLGFLGELKSKDHDFINKILGDLSIEHLAAKYITDCSDGEQQMILIARALAQDTPLILLDEVTAHLDFVNRIKIFQTLQNLTRKQDKLILMATHDLEIALSFADEVILFQNQSIQINTPSYFIENDIIHDVFQAEDIDYKLKL